MAKIDVFLSWSGKPSKYLGNRLMKYLPSIVPDVNLFFSPTITAGAQWAKKIERAIRDADYALLCVTKDNLNSSWMNFEAGALWKSPRRLHVCPLLLDITPNKLSGPLSVFQAKRFRKTEFYDICSDLARKTRLDVTRLQNNFKAIWPLLYQGVNNDLKRMKKRKRKSSRKLQKRRKAGKSK